MAILTGCAQPVLDPGINEATIRLLTRLGVEVVVPEGEGCCGALVHHMGREEQALASARANIDVWMREIDAGGLDAIIITASGCGTTIKDYGHMLRLDPAYAEKAARVSALAKDITEYLASLDLPSHMPRGITVAYHSACSMQHGQRITMAPKLLLKAAGFTVRDPAEGHLCCGSAGTYNILQPEISGELKARKVKNIEATKADIIATGNIGCITQIATGTGMPILHTVELLDWAYGGERPAKAEWARAGSWLKPFQEKCKAVSGIAKHKAVPQFGEKLSRLVRPARRGWPVCLPFHFEFVGVDKRQAYPVLPVLEEDTVDQAGNTVVERTFDEAADTRHPALPARKIGNGHTFPSAIGKHVDEPRDVSFGVNLVVDDDRLLAFRMDPVASVIGKAHAPLSITETPKSEST